MTKIFDRQLLLKRKTNRANIIHNADFLIKRSVMNIEEKLNDIDRSFFKVLNLGARIGYATEIMQRRAPGAKIIETDFCYKLLELNKSSSIKIVCDEELIPFAENSFDLIISVLTLHNVDDLLGCFYQLNKILDNDAVIIASLFGENNLLNLKRDIAEIELNETNKISPRFAPNIDIKQLGMLCVKAGFKDVVIDKDNVLVNYANAIDLLRDIQAMAESNILISQNYGCPSRKIWEKLSARKNYNAEFEILTLTARKDKN